MTGAISVFMSCVSTDIFYFNKIKVLQLVLTYHIYIYRYYLVYVY